MLNSLSGDGHDTLSQHHVEMPTIPLSMRTINEADPWPLDTAVHDGLEPVSLNQGAQDTLFTNVGEHAIDLFPPISQQDVSEHSRTSQGAETTTEQACSLLTNANSSSSSCDLAVHQQRSGSEKCTCIQFPEKLPEDDEVVAAEDFGHTASIPETKYTLLLGFWRTQQCAQCKATCQDASFISLLLLNTMIQLYYEYYDPWMPFLHPSMFEDSNIPWVLVLAVASVGCQYSDMKNSEVYLFGLRGLLQRALNTTVYYYPLFPPLFDFYLGVLIKTQEMEASSFHQLVFAQCLILRDVGLLFSGHEDDNRTAQYQKSMLATLTQPICLDDDIREDIPSGASSGLYRSWRQWVLTETRRRTLYCIWGESGSTKNSGTIIDLPISYGKLPLYIQRRTVVTHSGSFPHTPPQ